MFPHVSATSSDLLSPVLPASMTIVFSRRASCSISAANSPGDRTSGSCRRFVEALTLLIGFRLIHSLRMAWLNKADIMLRILLLVAGAYSRECNHSSTSTVRTSDRYLAPHLGPT